MTWYRSTPEGVFLYLHVQPNAKKTEIVGLHGERLKLRLKSPPLDGKANQCLIEFLSAQLKCKKQDIQITAGETSRDKTVFIAGPRAILDLLTPNS